MKKQPLYKSDFLLPTIEIFHEYLDFFHLAPIADMYKRKYFIIDKIEFKNFRKDIQMKIYFSSDFYYSIWDSEYYSIWDSEYKIFLRHRNLKVLL